MVRSATVRYLSHGKAEFELKFRRSGPDREIRAISQKLSADHLPPNDLERLEHFPPHTQRSNALRLERLFIHKHHFLLGHILKVRRVLVQSERAKPRRDVQYCQVEIFFVFLHTAAISCRG